jgi:transposase
VGFYDADYVCEELIPSDSFYRKFREIVEPLIEDEHFETMYCEDNGRPAISPALLAMATILQFYRNLSDREMERACMYDIEVKYALGLRLKGNIQGSTGVTGVRPQHETKQRPSISYHGMERQMIPKKRE